MSCSIKIVNVFFALVLVGLLPNQIRAADDFAALKTEYAPLGRLIVTPFATAPFPHPARANGHKYDGQFYSAAEHYSNSDVALFIPKNFRATDKIDFVVHFHGWRHTIATTLPEYKLIEQFADSGKNAILIVPQGPYNAPDSFDGKLCDTNGFARFMNEAMEKLRANKIFTNAEIGGVILSGHSGGYGAMMAIADHGGLSDKIREVWLFDALYAGTENFVAWQKNENGRLLDIYTDHGGTKENSENLIASYKTNGVSFWAGEDTNCPPEILRTNKIVFLHTDMAHDDVVGKRSTFEAFLKTSCLAPMGNRSEIKPINEERAESDDFDFNDELFGQKAMPLLSEAEIKQLDLALQKLKPGMTGKEVEAILQPTAFDKINLHSASGPMHDYRLFYQLRPGYNLMLVEDLTSQPPKFVRYTKAGNGWLKP